jgi:hypothetical protein
VKFEYRSVRMKLSGLTEVLVRFVISSYNLMLYASTIGLGLVTLKLLGLDLIESTIIKQKDVNTSSQRLRIPNLLLHLDYFLRRISCDFGSSDS